VTPTAILNELQTRRVVLFVEGGALRYRAPKGAITPELRQALIENKTDILTAITSGKGANIARQERGALDSLSSETAATADLTSGTIAAVKLVNTIIGDVWLVADDATLSEHPDIIRGGLPVIFFDEVEQLRGKTPAELKAIGMVKATFPTSRVLQ